MRTGQISMGRLQCEPCIPFVVEARRGTERIQSVATFTRASVRSVLELVPVGCFVTGQARLVFGRERQIPRGSLHLEQVNSCGLVLQLGVAFHAGYGPMAAQKRIAEALMNLHVHRGRSESEHVVTAEAVPAGGSGPVRRESSLVRIEMAGLAARVEQGQTHPRRSELFGAWQRGQPLAQRTVTRGAFRFPVASRQRQFEQRMLRCRVAGRLPVFYLMTGLAGAAVGSRGQLAAVQVSMTIATGFICRSQLNAGTPELFPRPRSCIPQMTALAASLEMSSFKEVAGRPMLFGRVGCGAEAQRVMTRVTVDHTSSERGLPGMRIGMAAGARFVGRRLTPAAGLIVAPLAVHRRVPSHEGVVRPRVIETRGHDLMEVLHHVTARASRTQSTCMWIAVTVRAVLMCDRLVTRDRLLVAADQKDTILDEMAFRAVDRRVLAGQVERGSRVIELRRGLPAPFIVAGEAVATECVLVIVVVAGKAPTLQAQPALLALLPRQQIGDGTALVFRLMAFAAGDRGVPALERPIRPGMVELLRRALVPADHLEIAAGVIRVTASAG